MNKTDYAMWMEYPFSHIRGTIADYLLANRSKLSQTEITMLEDPKTLLLFVDAVILCGLRSFDGVPLTTEGLSNAVGHAFKIAKLILGVESTGRFKETDALTREPNTREWYTKLRKKVAEPGPGALAARQGDAKYMLTGIPITGRRALVVAGLLRGARGDGFHPALLAKLRVWVAKQASASVPRAVSKQLVTELRHPSSELIANPVAMVEASDWLPGVVGELILSPQQMARSRSRCAELQEEVQAAEEEEERCASSHSVKQMLAQLITETRASTLAATKLASANHTDATTLASTNHTGAVALASTNHAVTVTQLAHARQMTGQQLLVQQVQAGQQALAQQSSDIAQQMAALVDESSRSQRGAPAPAPGAPAPVSPRRAFGRSLHREHRYRLRQAPFGRLGPPSLDAMM